MGKQAGRHTDWLCNECGLSVETGADNGGTDIGGAVKGLTLCQRKAGKPLPESSQVTYLPKLTQQVGYNGDGDEIAPTKRCEQ
jgi:hypothetical protein